MAVEEVLELTGGTTQLFRFDEACSSTEQSMPFLPLLLLPPLVDNNGPAVVVVVAVSTDISDGQSVVSVRHSFARSLEIILILLPSVFSVALLSGCFIVGVMFAT